MFSQLLSKTQKPGATQGTGNLLAKFDKGLIAGLCLVLAAWGGFGYYSYQKLIADVSREQVKNAAEQTAKKYARRLQLYFAGLRRDLERAGVIYDDSPQTVEKARRAVFQARPKTVAVQYFPFREGRAGSGTQVELNYALADLINRSEAGRPQLPEILKLKDKWQIHTAIRVTDGGRASEQSSFGSARPESVNFQPAGREKLLGTILVTIAFEDISQEFAAFDQSEGQITVTQKFPDALPQVLWRAGTGGASEVASIHVADSHLYMEFVASPAFAKRYSESGTLLVSAFVAVALLSALLLIRLYPEPKPKVVKRKPVVPRPLTPAELEVDEKYMSAREARARHKQKAVESLSEMPAAAPTASEEADYPDHIFRAYDIRGIAGDEITEPFAYQLGRALGTLALEEGERMMVVARDGRTTSATLSSCLIEGILSTGCHTVDLGLVPTPVMYFVTALGKATHSGVMVTASHNPAEYNGFKIVIGGRQLADDRLQELLQRMRGDDFRSGAGKNRQQDVSANYIDHIYNDVALAGTPKLVIDAGNGATGELAPRLFEQLGCQVTKLFCEIDGRFPNHAPDPSRPENLEPLVQKVQEAGVDLGIALDGDGDRVTLVSSSGRICWPDQLLMLFARDVLSRHPGADVIFDVKCSRAVTELVNQYGGRPVMWKTGHSPMKAKMQETGALIGGELSGHIFIKERWFGFDDGMYAAARLLEIMALREQSLDELLDSLPQYVSTPEILLPVSEAEKFALVETLLQQGDFGDGDVTTVDGIRVDYADGWGLVRASNTTAALTLRFEAVDEAALARIRQDIALQLQRVAPDLRIPG
ncbi:phosphomannomutase/phosphoglucomutase [Biformimicrobium ophioploci]|uniref:phosphomannomutase n=1 Tax=Biformimicrobium ophioploci TaxID=3036711 RepID=A0ABQ6LVQ2_9GAMM|nr:phosphomannomutase/phosphoglucomutase [Microbulbifer sp. NKW57]GMG86168.1 hypothetical protein MNKW57_04890 [Microbulbifer sp. NKW57]